MAARDLPGSVRDRFPIFARKVYVNSCSQGALSDSVRAAYPYLDDWDRRGAPWRARRRSPTSTRGWPGCG